MCCLGVSQYGGGVSRIGHAKPSRSDPSRVNPRERLKRDSFHEGLPKEWFSRDHASRTFISLFRYVRATSLYKKVGKNSPKHKVSTEVPTIVSTKAVSFPGPRHVGISR